MSDVNTNVSDVGGRSLSKLEAFLCSACPSAKAENDYETVNLLLSIQQNGVLFSFLVCLFVCLFVYLFVCFVLFLGGSGPPPSTVEPRLTDTPQQRTPTL